MLSLSRSDDTGADRIVRSFFVRYGPVPKALFFKNSFYKNGLKEWSFVKKRILSFFLVLCLTLGLLPSTALASGTAQPVSNPEDFAAMDPSGDYILTSDITVSAPYGQAFSGSFDGGGHKVTLAISGDSKLGLFSELSSGATVRNVITDGSVSGTSQVGGIAGLSSGTIENCLNTASITAGSKYAGGIAGQCTGGSITGCGNTGSVALSGTDQYAGGIAGQTKATAITNCYNQGEISSQRNRSGANLGGIVGYAGDDYGRGSSLNNCYSTGAITVQEKATNFGAIAGWMYNSTSENCYYLDSSCTIGINGNDQTATAKTSEEMKGADFAAALGEGFRVKAGDYPVLSWQISTASAVFTIAPSAAVLTIRSGDTVVYSSSQGETRIAALAAGSYTYTVSCEGYTAQTGEITVSEGQASGGAEIRVELITLGLDNERWGTLRFQVEGAEDYTITVTLDGQEITAGEDGTYTLLLDKTYDYVVTPTSEQVEGAQGSIPLSESKIETVSLKTVTGIAVKTQPVKTDYYVGDALDTAGLVVTVSYSDGSTREISEGVDVSGFDSSAAGEKTVTVTYCGSSATFPVTVSEKPFPSAVFNALVGKAQVAYTHNDKYQGEPGQEFVEEDGVLHSNSKGQGNSQVTVTITIDESVAQGSLSFWYKVSSEGSWTVYDGLAINNGSKIGGEINWTKHTLDVKGGETVTLTYVKDSSGDKGDDCVYLKDFTLETLHTATFTLSPENAQIVLAPLGGGEAIAPASSSGGTVIYALADGTYDYTVSCFGYAEQTGQITVNGADVEQTVTLDASARQTVTFQVTRPEDISAPYEISVLFQGEPVPHSGDDADVYQLPAGEYTYTVSCEGCEPASGSFTVGEGAATVPVMLERQWTLSDYFKAISPAITAENGTRYGFVRDTEQDGGLISDNAGKSSSSAAMTLTFSQAARLDFAYWVSSEANYDKFTLKHGTDTLVTASGNGEWTQFAVSVAAGDSLIFQYEKDSGGNEGSDTVRLKNFRVTALYPLTYTGLPEGGTFAVRDSKGQTIAPQSDGTYLLPEGAYTYTASAFGYETAQGSVAIPGQNSVFISLTKLPTYTVTFQIPERASLAVTHPTVGSMDAFRQGDAFTLPAGETYSYEVTKANCLPSRGSFTLTEDCTIEVGALTNAGEGWDGTTVTEPTQTEGVYRIGSAAELAWFAQRAESETGVKGQLTANINLNGKPWTGIKQFAGTLDGSGHVISGLTAPLFDTVSDAGSIKNLVVMGSITGSGHLGGIVSTLSGTVENCAFEGSVTNSGPSYGSVSLGAIAGRAQKGSIIRGCAVLAELKNNTASYNTALHTGSIAGYAYGVIENCYAAGSVWADSSRDTNSALGGLVGTLYADGTLRNAYFSGTVTGPENGIGLVIGANKGTVENTFFLPNGAIPAVADNTASTAPAVTKTSAEQMRTDAFAYGLGSAFHMDTDGINSGFPILSWQGGSAPVVSTDEEDAAADLAALNLQTTDGKAISADSHGIYQIRNALTLALPGQGEHGSAITWTASPEDGISLSDGMITLPENGKLEVTLTAQVKKGEASKQKEFRLVLWSQGAQDLETLEGIRDEAQSGGTFIQPLEAYGHTNIRQTMEQYLLRKDYPVDMAQYRYDDDPRAIKVEFVAPGTKVLPQAGSYLANDGTITYYRDEGGLGINYALYRDVTFRLLLGDQSVQVSMTVHIGWANDYLEDYLSRAVNSITWEQIRGKNANTATVAQDEGWWYTVTVDGQVDKDLILPTRLDTYGDVRIQWSSTDTDALTVQTNPDGSYTATLNRPPFGGDPFTFPLIATARFNRLDDYMIQEATAEGAVQDWYAAIRKFVITVAPNDVDQSAQINEALEKYPSLLRDFVDKETPVTPTQVTADLQMPTPGQLESAGILPDRYNQKVTMTSSNTDVLEFSGYHAMVYRPLPGSPAVDVSYTVRILDRRNNALLGEKTFSLTVQPLTEDEINSAAAFMDSVCTENAYWNGIRGKNTDKTQVTENLEPFAEVLKGDQGQPQYIYGAINLTFGGAEVDDLPGYDPMNAQPWREYRSSRPTVIACENLLVTRPEYDTKVTLDSVLTHSAYGKYWEKFGSNPAYAQFEQFYKRPVSVTVTVKGTKGGENPNPQPEQIQATVSVSGGGFENFADLSAYTFTGSGSRDWTAWDALQAALREAGYRYEGSGSYVSAVTDSNGVTLSELEHGEGSGWMYRVNGTLPEVTLNQYYLSDGDKITFFYTGDYHTVPGTHGYDDNQKAAQAVEKLINAIGTVTKDSGDKIEAARKAYDALTDTQKKLVRNYDVLTEAETAFAALEAGLPFTDVDKDAWYFEAVQYVYKNGLFNGTSATAFSPDGEMSRAMLAAVLYRLAGSPAGGGEAIAFTDVALDAWYSDAVAWANGNGVVTGYGNGLFGGADSITREQLVVMLYRYARLMKHDTAAAGDLSAFTDAGDTSDWAVEALRWAYAEGLITGRTATTIVPQGTATRAEVAMILMRFGGELAK